MTIIQTKFTNSKYIQFKRNLKLYKGNDVLYCHS